VGVSYSFSQARYDESVTWLKKLSIVGDALPST
jgi:hypothetical protein